MSPPNLPLLIASTLLLPTFAFSATTITGAAFDPNDPSTGLVSNGDLTLSSGILTFDLATQNFSGAASGSGTLIGAPIVANDYIVYLFDSIDLGAGVTIQINNASGTSPGIALLSLSNFTLNTNISYNSSSVSHDGGDIVLVAENTLLVSSTVSSLGHTAPHGNQTGSDGGHITLAATNMNLDGSMITAQGGSGHNSQKPRGNGGDIDIYTHNLTGTFTTNVDPGAVGSGGSPGTYAPQAGLAYLQVPEPSSTTFLMGGFIVLALRRNRKQVAA